MSDEIDKMKERLKLGDGLAEELKVLFVVGHIIYLFTMKYIEIDIAIIIYTICGIASGSIIFEIWKD